MRFFNTAGPIRPEKHYCIPALERLDMGEVLRLVRDEQYFVLCAARQTGKTSILLAGAVLKLPNRKISKSFNNYSDSG